MKRVKLIVAYDGTNYHGWQVQPNGITIEEVLNGALSGLLGEAVTVTGASRTRVCMLWEMWRYLIPQRGFPRRRFLLP